MQSRQRQRWPALLRRKANNGTQLLQGLAVGAYLRRDSCPGLCCCSALLLSSACESAPPRLLLPLEACAAKAPEQDSVAQRSQVNNMQNNPSVTTQPTG